MTKIAPPRIGTGNAYFAAGWITLAIGVLLGIVAAAGGTGAGAIGSLFLLISGGCFSVGFWFRLFGALERRMIDIQESLVSGPHVADAGAEPPSIITGR